MPLKQLTLAGRQGFDIRNEKAVVIEGEQAPCSLNRLP